MATLEQFFAGDDVVLNVDITDEDTGDPIDLTGVSIDFLLRIPGADITKSVGSGITVTDAVNGLADVAIDSADTLSVINSGAPDSKYEIQITDGGKISTVKFSTMNIKGNLIP